MVAKERVFQPKLVSDLTTLANKQMEIFSSIKNFHHGNLNDFTWHDSELRNSLHETFHNLPCLARKGIRRSARQQALLSLESRSNFRNGILSFQKRI